MLFSTLRQFASISGRTILAIGLTSATVLALAPSAKAADPSPSGAEVGGNLEQIETIAFTSSTGTGARVALTKTGALAIANTKLGSLKVVSNNPDGFTVTVASTNKLLLKQGSYSIAYTLTRGTANDPIVFTDDVGAVVDPVFTPAYAAENGVTEDIKINTTASTHSIPAGEYTDTLTFSYVGK
jgi:hypothetical protein